MKGGKQLLTPEKDKSCSNKTVVMVHQCVIYIIITVSVLNRDLSKNGDTTIQNGQEFGECVCPCMHACVCVQVCVCQSWESGLREPSCRL